MSSYIDIQNTVMGEHPKVRIVSDSQCWRRTHAHCGKSDPMRGSVCKWKQAESYASTLTLLHEIGHIQTHKSGMTRAESETEATRWAFDQLRRFGLPIKRKYRREYNNYVAMCYYRARRRGLKRRIKGRLLCKV